MVLRTEEGNHGEVTGMTYAGIFKGTIERKKGIYGINTYSQGTSFVQGKHYTPEHYTEVDGFYTNYDESGVIKTKYIVPTPEEVAYYQWIIGKISTEIYYENIELITTKYATTGTYV